MKLIVQFAKIILFSALVFGGHFLIEWDFFRQAEKNSIEKSRQKAIFLVSNFEITANYVDVIINDIVFRLAQIQNFEEAGQILQTRVLPSALLQLALINKDGLLVASSLSNFERVDLSDREHFRVHRDGLVESDQMFISVPVLGRVSNRWTIQFTKSIRDQMGTFSGVLVASFAVDAFVENYSKFPMDRDYLISLTGFDGIIRARSVSIGDDAFGMRTPIISLHEQIVKNGSQSVIFTSPIDGIRRSGWVEVSNQHPIYIISAEPVPNLLASTWPRHLSWLLLLALSLGLASLARQRLHNNILTERLEAAARTAEIARLVSLGELAAGLGHEIATPANTILQAAANMSRAIESNRIDVERFKTKLQRISGNAARIRALMEAVRTHARKSDDEPYCDASQAVQSALFLVRSQLDLIGISIETRVYSDNFVPCAQTEIETVIINLILNARDAIQSTQSDSKFIRLSCITVGREVWIIVEDSGGGINEKIKDKIFQPFFTTKPVGSGTGIGLSTVLRIINTANGKVEFDNTQFGARFTIKLPKIHADNKL